MTRSRQNWSVGQTVRVGFLTLVVVGTFARDEYAEPRTGYTLRSLDGARYYEFVPHLGLTRIA